MSESKEQTANTTTHNNPHTTPRHTTPHPDTNAQAGASGLEGQRKDAHAQTQLLGNRDNIVGPTVRHIRVTACVASACRCRSSE